MILKKQKKEHIFLLVSQLAVENIDAIIKIIKSSKDTEAAKKNLINKKWTVKKSTKLISLIEKVL